MSRYNLTKMMESYTDDFGNSYDNINVQIQKDTPVLSLYVDRATTLCGSGKKLFSPRYLLATFSDGRKIKYPIPKESDVKAMSTELLDADAVCLDYYGEKWNILVGATVGGALEYRSDNYTGLVSSKDFETGSFEYTSNLAITGLTTFRLPYRIPSNDNAALTACQKEGMEDIKAASGICSAAGLISPRRLIIRAKANDGNGVIGSVSRNALVSKAPAGLKATAIAIAECAFCLSYRGENFPGIHNYV